MASFTVTVMATDVADAMHLSGTTDLPDGYEYDISTAEDVVNRRVVPHADSADEALVTDCATFVAAAFITGTEGDRPVSQVSRESQTINYDTDSGSAESADYWARAVQLDPTGHLSTGRIQNAFEDF